MKKILLVILFLSTNVHAGFYESDYFEPVTLCAVGGVVGFVSASDGDEPLTAGIYCAGGALTGWLLNMYQRKKIDRVNEDEISILKKEVDKKVAEQARRAAQGDTQSPYTIRAKQINEGEKQPDGTYISPTERIIIMEP